jgi:3-hydroxybutyrate dehydrogenase
MNTNSLKGRTALISGSTSGIGAAYARTLAAAGASVMINGLGDPSMIETIRRELEVLSGAPSRFCPADMSKPDQITEMVEQCHQTLGGPDILIANAGMQHIDAIECFPVDQWNQLIAVNLSSAFHLMRASIPHMKKKKWGRIIATASVHSMVASSYKSAYVASKHALVGLIKTAALEGASFGITANCISPGYVWTPLVENQIPATMKARSLSRAQVIDQVLLGNQPTGQFVEPAQIASLALFLCSDEAAQITGSNYSIDGGYTSQ